VTILVITVVEKFGEGLVTLAITLSLIALCTRIRRHYRRVRDSVRSSRTCSGAACGRALLQRPAQPERHDSHPPRDGYNGSDPHCCPSIASSEALPNFIFVSVAEIIREFQGERDRGLGLSVEEDLRSTSPLRPRIPPTTGRCGTEAVETATDCARKWRRNSEIDVFAGKLVFRRRPLSKDPPQRNGFASETLSGRASRCHLPVRVSA